MSFGFKLLLAMMAVVLGVTGLTLAVATRKMAAAQEAAFERQFETQSQLFNSLQEARMAGIREKSAAFVRSVRVTSILEDTDPEVRAELYTVSKDEFMRPGSPRVNELRFFRFFDAEGKIIAPPQSDEFKAWGEIAHISEKIARTGGALTNSLEQQTGYLASALEGAPVFYELIFTKIVDAVSDELLGGLVLGFDVKSDLMNSRETGAGFFIEKSLHFPGLSQPISTPLQQRLETLAASGREKQGHFDLAGDSVLYRCFFRLLNPSSNFPPAYQVSLFSLAETMRQQRELRYGILTLGALGLLAGLAISFVLSHGLTTPILQLVRATQEVERGNLEIRVPEKRGDELGKLASSFNEMTAGLALKEKYRSVLNLVADKEVARELVGGRVALGGELREISVIFCDIRGFTALTQNMPPEEVIQMLNEHFTPLTQVVYEHHGVVDKFVGDLIMAVFGAPRGFGNDALNAAKCALRMLQVRHELNERPDNRKIQMGIGIATGTAVAGCMGSSDRMNYTVLGERVNLASRLCSQAGRMEVVIDQTTWDRVQPGGVGEPLAPLKLKGFDVLVQAYKLTAIHADSEQAASAAARQITDENNP